MVSVCLPSDALLQHLPSYLGFSYLGHGVSLHSCSSKEQLLLLILYKEYLLTTTLPDLQRGRAPLGPPVLRQPPLLGGGIALPSSRPWPWAWGCSSWSLPWLRGWGCFFLPPPLALGTAPGLGCGVAPLSCHPWNEVRDIVQGSRPSPWKRNANKQNGCLGKPYK